MSDKYIIAPIIIPGLSIPRFHEELGEYNITFSSEYIYNKWKNTDIEKLQINLEHSEEIIPCKVIDSFLKKDNFEHQLKNKIPFVSNSKIKDFLDEFGDLPNGTCFNIYEFQDSNTLKELLDSGKSGVSVEMTYSIEVNGKRIRVKGEFNRMDLPSDKLPYELHLFGGSTWGLGRNEHGKAHFQIKKNHKDIDKVFVPYSSEWEKAKSIGQKIELLKSEKGRVNRKDKKKIAEWLSSNDKLSICHRTWNEINKDNKNRVEFIF